jgi:hypothetical protein
MYASYRADRQHNGAGLQTLRREDAMEFQSSSQRRLLVYVAGMLVLLFALVHAGVAKALDTSTDLRQVPAGKTAYPRGAQDRPDNREGRVGSVEDNGYTLLAWNNLGMHCYAGSDYSIFSILPPLNT